MNWSVRRAAAAERDAATRVLQEYFAAVDVLVRDSPAQIERYLSAAGSGLWLAWRQDVAGSETVVGCIALRPLPELARAGEVKRLYVRPECRGMGVARALLQALEEEARRQGMQWLYLDSKDDLEAAIAFYLRSGYEPCERYNRNPQATIFLRKQLMPNRG